MLKVRKYEEDTKQSREAKKEILKDHDIVQLHFSVPDHIRRMLKVTLEKSKKKRDKWLIEKIEEFYETTNKTKID